MMPVISFVGRSESGKTTLIEKVIVQLKARGYRIGVAKHAPHGFDVDRPGKDSWRFAGCGADVVAVASTDRIAVFERTDVEPGLDRLATFFFGKVDILVVEGYKSSAVDKILVMRSDGGEAPPACAGRILDVVCSRTSPNGAAVFGPEVVNRVVHLLILQMTPTGSRDSIESPATRATPAPAGAER